MVLVDNLFGTSRLWLVGFSKMALSNGLHAVIGQMCYHRGGFVAQRVTVIYTRLARERLSPGGLRGLQTR